MEPITLVTAAILSQLQTSNFIGSLLGGIIGNRSDALLCDGVKKIYNSINNNVDKPGSHDIQKAVRNSYLKATLMAVKKTQSKYSMMDNLSLYNPSRLRSVESYIKGELDLLKKGNVQFQLTVFDEEYQPLISPTEGTASGRLTEMVTGLKESVFHELARKGLNIDSSLRKIIATGWEEKGKAIDWYELTCAFFSEELKTNTRLSAFIQTDYLREISNDLDEVGITINKFESRLEVFFKDYELLLPKVDEILAHVIDIDEKVDQLPEKMRDMVSEELKNFAPDLDIPDFTVPGRHQKLMGKIESLNKEEREIILEVKDLKMELGEATEERRERLKRILSRTETTHIELARKRQKAENELQDFVTSVLKLAEQFTQLNGPITPRLEKARELFNQGQYEAVDEVLNEKDIYADIETHRERAKELADELMVKAQATVINKGSGWFELADKYYAEAATFNTSYNTCFQYADFLGEHKQIQQAADWYEKSLLFVEDEVRKSLVLNNLANQQHAKNEFDKAETNYLKALEIRKGLAESNPPTSLSALALTLNNLAVLLDDKNEFDKAEARYFEALEIKRKLAETNPKANLSSVALTLNNLATLQRSRNELDKAETNYLEALRIYRVLAAFNPQVHLPSVASTLNNLASLQRGNNEFVKAESNYSEALIIRKKLAKSNPQTYLYAVSNILNNLASLQFAINEFDKAEANYYEALEIRRKLCKSNPQTYLSSVATTLDNLASLQRDTNEFDKAKINFMEALEIRRNLAISNPQFFLSAVADTLHNLAILQGFMNDFDKAGKYFSEALEIRRKLARSNPKTYLSVVADTLNYISKLHRAKHEYDRAEANCSEALEIRRKLATSNPQAYLSAVADSLNNLAKVEHARNEFDKAEANYSKALGIYKDLAGSNPQAYLSAVADSLNNLAMVEHARNKFDNAEANYMEALVIRRKLAISNPDIYLSTVAMSLNCLANLQSAKNEFDNAVANYLEALEIRRKLAAANPQNYLSDVATTLNNLANLLGENNEFEQAKANYTEALEIRKGLATSNPQRYKIEYASTAVNLAILYRSHLIDKQQSIFYAQEAINGYSLFADTVPLAGSRKKTAEGILAYWAEK